MTFNDVSWVYNFTVYHIRMQGEVLQISSNTLIFDAFGEAHLYLLKKFLFRNTEFLILLRFYGHDTAL